MRKTNMLQKPAALTVAQVVTSQDVAAMLNFLKNFELKNARRKLSVLRRKK